jgi:hypothetical protein
MRIMSRFQQRKPRPPPPAPSSLECQKRLKVAYCMLEATLVDDALCDAQALRACDAQTIATQCHYDVTTTRTIMDDILGNAGQRWPAVRDVMRVCVQGDRMDARPLPQRLLCADAAVLERAVILLCGESVPGLDAVTGLWRGKADRAVSVQVEHMRKFYDSIGRNYAPVHDDVRVSVFERFEVSLRNPIDPATKKRWLSAVSSGPVDAPANNVVRPAVTVRKERTQRKHCPAVNMAALTGILGLAWRAAADDAKHRLSWAVHVLTYALGAITGRRVIEVTAYRDDDFHIVLPNRTVSLRDALLRAPDAAWAVMKQGFPVAFPLYHAKHRRDSDTQEFAKVVTYRTLLPDDWSGFDPIRAVIAIMQVKLAKDARPDDSLVPGDWHGKTTFTDCINKFRKRHFARIAVDALAPLVQFTPYCGRYGWTAEFRNMLGDIPLMAWVLGHGSLHSQEDYVENRIQPDAFVQTATVARTMIADEETEPACRLFVDGYATYASQLGVIHDVYLTPAEDSDEARRLVAALDGPVLSSADMEQALDATLRGASLRGATAHVEFDRQCSDPRVADAIKALTGNTGPADDDLRMRPSLLYAFAANARRMRVASASAHPFNDCTYDDRRPRCVATECVALSPIDDAFARRLRQGDVCHSIVACIKDKAVQHERNVRHTLAVVQRKRAAEERPSASNKRRRTDVRRVGVVRG